MYRMRLKQEQSCCLSLTDCDVYKVSVCLSVCLCVYVCVGVCLCVCLSVSLCRSCFLDYISETMRQILMKLDDTSHSALVMIQRIKQAFSEIIVKFLLPTTLAFDAHTQTNIHIEINVVEVTVCKTCCFDLSLDIEVSDKSQFVQSPNQ